MKNNSFEDRLTRLEEISNLIKTGQIPLDEAVDSFEEGMKLATSLEKDLKKIEKKVEILMNPIEDKTNDAEIGLFDDIVE
ncbi:exodeoxyribonuclease VII small subunit [Spirochaeta cellobiosiphila]|uniref:exodeoxyribonuclease VII small subunit n=1 Tax=Spirochaeta cellobiosiphila TaxID=504483 RepID=UPI00040B071C|nr:exodeoxyribonuclease VII small subunit [Spirochaeta cellobiosiphila]